MVLRIGIAGLSRGLAHVRAFQSLSSRVSIVALCDLNEDALKKAKTYLPHAETYKDFKEMVAKAELDAVVIATPTYLHAPMTIYACEEHTNVLVEKPMALTSDECTQMIKAAERYGVKLQVGFNYHYAKHFQEIRRILKNGEFGDPLNVYSSIRFCGPDFLRKEPPSELWYFNKKMSGGGCLINLGAHLVEIHLSVIGDIGQVSSIMHTTELRKRYGVNVEDITLSVFMYKSGVPGLLECTYTSFTEKMPRVNFNVSFSSAFVESFWTVGRRACLIAQKNTASRLYSSIKGIFKQRILKENTELEQAEAFLKCIEEDTKPVVPGQIGKRVAEIIEAMYRSAETDRIIFCGNFTI
jgi:predicted dehydrogenase